MFFLLFSFSLQNINAGAVPKNKEVSVYANRIVKSTIHTVQMHPAGLDLAYPVMELGGENHLVLSFDELGEEVQNYSYRLIHCNADWTVSNLNEFDFIEGFTENQIDRYELSFNTNFEYIHYKVILPNENIQFKISGNYIIEVYQDFDHEKVVLTQRFMVVEPLVEIKGLVKRPVNIDLLKTHQEVDFSIFHRHFHIDNPQVDLKVVLTQNNRWDNSERFLKPIFIRPNELVFDFDEENVFPGGNEFRYFDIKSLRFHSRHIKEITEDHSEFYVTLFPDVNRYFRHYLYEQDINGNYLVTVEERDDPATEADYARVKFTLPMEAPMLIGKFYVYGQLTNWSCTEQNVMKYNFNSKAYELTLLLKQGYYNYQYSFLRKDEKIPDMTLVEGSHQETENSYVIYVYYYDLAKNYDRLIGWQVINSLNYIH